MRNYDIFVAKIYDYALIDSPTSNSTLPTMTTDLVPAGITENRPFLRFAEKNVFLLLKIRFFSKENTLTGI